MLLLLLLLLFSLETPNVLRLFDSDAPKLNITLDRRDLPPKEAENHEGIDDGIPSSNDDGGNGGGAPSMEAKASGGCALFFVSSRMMRAMVSALSDSKRYGRQPETWTTNLADDDDDDDEPCDGEEEDEEEEEEEEEEEDVDIPVTRERGMYLRHLVRSSRRMVMIPLFVTTSARGMEHP